MAKGKAAWGIEVGAYEIKAIRLEDGGETGVPVTTASGNAGCFR